MRRSKTRFRIRGLALAVCSVLAVLAPAAHAAAWERAPLGVLAHAEEVSDEVLGGMRGRYVASQGQVVRFGIEAITQWEMPDGAAYAATALLDVNLLGAVPQIEFIPNITVRESSGLEEIAPTGAAPGAVVSGGAGLAEVSGVAQSIQVAGEGNGIANDTAVSVSNEAPAFVASGGAAPGTQVSTTTAAGVSVSAGLTGGGLAVAISVPGVGQALQQIRGGAGGGAGIRQMVAASGDLQRINNQLTLHVQFDAAGLSRGLALQQALGMLRGLPGGLF